jgi:uncharacterized membrane protein
VVAEIQIGGHLVLDPVMAPVWTGVVLLALAGAMALAAWRWPMPLARGRRVALIVLRALVVVALAMLLLKPEVRWKGRQEVLGEVAFLMDGSRSMAIRDAVVPEARLDKAGRGTPENVQESVRGASTEPPRESTEDTTHRGGSGDPPRTVSGDPPRTHTHTLAQTVSRLDAVRFAFLTAGKSYADLAAKWIINPYAFGTSTRPIGNFAPQSADPRTDFADALGTMVVRQERGTGPYDDKPSPLAAVVVISDGRATRSRGSAEAAARLLGQRGVKVHAVAVGSDRPSDSVCDVAVRDLRAPERVFVGNRPQVRAVVATLGMAGKKVEAVLLVNGNEVARLPVVPAADRSTQEIVYAPPLDVVGPAKIVLAVEPVPGELVTMNNRAETIVRVEEGGIRVLYLDGRLHPEGKYIARALGDAKEIELDRRILFGGAAQPPSTGSAAGKSAQLGAATPPVAAEEIDKFNVVILGDLPAVALAPAAIARLAERVRSGGAGFLALGGLAAYGAGGWAATPLAEVLPFAMAAGDGQIEGRVKLKLTSGGRQHFIFNLDGADGLKMDFDALPPLAGASAVGPLHPAARLLAESDGGKAILAVREHARGRAAGLTIDTTWQWVLASDAAGQGGRPPVAGAEVHRRFWRQLVLWLAGRDGRPREDFWILTDRPRYSIADRARPPVAEVTVHAPAGAAPRVRVAGPAVVPGVSGEGGMPTQPLRGHVLREGDSMPSERRAGHATRVDQGAPGSLGTSGPAEADIKVESAGAGEWRGSVGLGKPGEYTLSAAAEIGGAAKHAETLVSVEEQDFELAEILADHENLRRIAQAGGGMFREITGLRDLMADLAANLPPSYREIERRLPLAEGRVFLGIVVGLLAAEWALRRRWGLV